MTTFWTPEGIYRQAQYESEAELEAAILEVQSELFGLNRVYLPVKKKMGNNIPDGYLLDLSGQKPQLYVVENELSSHEPLKHIAVQILKFSLSFDLERHKVKSILLALLNDEPVLKAQCEKYVADRAFRNLDHLLEHLVFDVPFAALVIIDELMEDLETIFAKKFAFVVEVLQLTRYRNVEGKCVYWFEPFLADVGNDLNTAPQGGALPAVDPDDLDTVVVPAHAEGLTETFLGEDRWYQVRLHSTMRPRIKYIAVYEVAPISAITHVAPVKSIEPWENTGKFVLNFSAPAKPIGPIPLVPIANGGRVKALQNLRYTTRARLDAAKTLDDIW